MASVATRVLPSSVQEKLENLYLQIRAPVTAQLLWERVLTAAERETLGDEFTSAFPKMGTLGMWTKLKGVSRPRALVDVALALGFVNEPTQRWLLRELGEIHDDPEDAIQAAVAAGGLVLHDRPREAFWRAGIFPRRSLGGSDRRDVARNSFTWNRR